MTARKPETPAKRKPGRPSKYTPAVIERICERLETGEPMAQICRDEGMPAVRTVLDWVEQRPDVSASIARARQIGFDKLASDCLEIADAPDITALPDGTKEMRDSKRDKLRVWTRLQLLAKWDPKRYGDRMVLAGDPESPMEHRHALSDAQLEMIAARGRSDG